MRDRSFADFGFDSEVVELLSVRGITVPTDVQQLAIPEILGGGNVVVRSQTGSGKTLAYLLPISRNINDVNGVVLVVVPTRELALQVAGQAALLPAFGDSVAVIYGGVEYGAQIEALAATPKLVVATPGRLLDLVAQGAADIVGKVAIFVLDEVDQMVDMGFRESIAEIAGYRMIDAQTMCFSATLPNGVEELISGVAGSYKLLECLDQKAAAQTISQSAYFVEQSMMEHLLKYLLQSDKPDSAIVFCRSKGMADRLVKQFEGAEAFHSDRSQAAREHILQRFRDRETTLLIATDVLARGIDVANVSHVYNFGLPQAAEQYLHRIGRTGRAGAEGVARSLVCPDERKMLQQICATMKQSVEIVKSHPYLTPAVSKAMML
ncbi:MAG: DEAD/DEAH box helicase [Rikenellaceae bacterium]